MVFASHTIYPLQICAAAEKVNQVIASCKKRGLIIGKNGDTVAGFNNVLTLAPPLCLTEDELQYIVKVLKESVNELS